MDSLYQTGRGSRNPFYCWGCRERGRVRSHQTSVLAFFPCSFGRLGRVYRNIQITWVSPSTRRLAPCFPAHGPGNYGPLREGLSARRLDRRCSPGGGAHLFLRWCLVPCSSVPMASRVPEVVACPQGDTKY